jgi:hypothetical protein
MSIEGCLVVLIGFTGTGVARSGTLLRMTQHEMKPASLLIAIPRLGIPRLPAGGGKRLLAPGTKCRVGACKQFGEVALFEGASGSCRRGLHLH